MVREQDLTSEDRDKTRHGRLTEEQVEEIRAQAIADWKDTPTPDVAPLYLNTALLCYKFLDCRHELNKIHENQKNTLKGILHRWPLAFIGCVYFTLTVATGLGALVFFIMALQTTSPLYAYLFSGALCTFLPLIAGVFSGVMQLFLDDK